MLSLSIAGHNVTVFAYGQTGSGKSFTMGTNDKCEAVESNPNLGVIPRALRDVFASILERSDSHDVKVSVAYVEMYQDQFRDLLSKPTASKVKIDIREGPNGSGQILKGASELTATSFKQVMEFVARGNKRRSVGATAMNSQSSRSHAILTINIWQNPKESP